MTAATLTEYSGVPIPGVKKGSCVAQNAYTSTFGFKTLKGVLLTVDSDNDAIVTCAIATGSGTIKLVDDAGSDIAANTTIYYWAWGE